MKPLRRAKGEPLSRSINASAPLGLVTGSVVPADGEGWALLPGAPLPTWAPVPSTVNQRTEKAEQVSLLGLCLWESSFGRGA